MEPDRDSMQERGSEAADQQARRGFLAGMAATAVATVAALPPLAAGIIALMDPLRRRNGDDTFVMVTHLSAVPEGGTPKRFQVESERRDAWTTHQKTPVGAVYLRRTDTGVQALNAVCPHAGCFVALVDGGARFGCPCHRSSFALDGAINDPDSPSPRDMDALDVEIRSGEEVWVRFQSFLPGREERVPV